MTPDIPLHPVVVHFPIALLVVSALLALAGLLRDQSWLRRAASLLFVLGFLGAVVALRTGEASEEAAEKQGVPHEAIEEHEAAGTWVVWLTSAGVVALIATAAKPLRAVATAVLLVLQLMSAVAAVVTGLHGGKLVYHHGAGVSIAGQPVQHPDTGTPPPDDGED
jgi:uncharacterized membrane protein